MENTFFKNALLSVFLFTTILYSQSKIEKEEIISQTNVSSLKKLATQFDKEHSINYERIMKIANEYSWPISFINADGNYSELHEVTSNRIPLYRVADNQGSAFTSRSNKLQPNGGLGLNLTGKDLYVGVWDQNNVNNNHVDFGGRSFVFDNSANATSSHATHVTGTIISSGASSAANLGRGIAYEAYAYTNSWTNDLAEMASLAVNNGLLVSNHSYGLDTSNPSSIPEYIFGAYRSSSRNLDQITFDAPYYQPVIAAGNNRNKTLPVNALKNGYDLLSDFGTSKNAIVVAAVEGLGVAGYVNTSSVIMSNFSSWGPTDDNRIKPDISTKGVNVYSTTNDASNTSYATSSGTSMAAPGVTATLLLLQQHYLNINSDFMRSATLRGLIAHSADEAGDSNGPDARFGWGLLNAEKAAGLITNAAVINGEVFIKEFDSRTSSLINKQTYTKIVKSKSNQPLVATISWTEKAGVPNGSEVDLTTPVLVNDLDIRITKGAEIYYPWRLGTINTDSAVQGDNMVDNIEKIEINTPGNETYTITVSHKGNLYGGSQDFSLIVSGIDQSNLAVNDNSFKSVNIWPNPMNDLINITAASDNSEEIYLEIYNMLGVKQINKKLNSNNLLNTINVNALSPGFYIFKIKQRNIQSVWKILKN